MSKVVKWRVFDPRHSFFKTKANDRAEVSCITCTLDGECPLLAKGYCISENLFDSCIYGKKSKTEGPTKRSTSISSWVQEQRNRYNIPNPNSPPDKMAFIGNYVWLPYAHMTLLEGIPFVQHSTVFSRGMPFILKGDWTPEVVLDLIKFKPQALMGGEIISYQREEIPKFIQHLREVDPEMFALVKDRIFEIRPDLVQMSNVGRKALLSTGLQTLTNVNVFRIFGQQGLDAPAFQRLNWQGVMHD